ncbi:MAG TPA: NADH pyrophosphatase zinc ribbon domain-containing protein, partial [Propionibacteriaceae bacterium]|nr:NADH pyrophosphatase zinc ribbon domain-containing protein [Propionibacteriaceae bacterium]
MTNWAMASDLDRVDHHRRSPEWVAGLWRAEDAKLLKLDDQSRFTTNAGGSKLRMTKPFVEYDSQRHRLLGLLDAVPVFAVETLTEGEVHDMREVGHQLSDNERDIAATAAALTHWHRREPRCARCGGQTIVINGGFARHCESCGEDHFPRTDPAVIVAVV